MAKFVTIGYGDQAGYERTEPAVRDAAHQHDARLKAAGALRPDVILLDVQLPDLTGFEVTRRLVSDGVPTVVVLVSSRDASDHGDEIASSGAAGFVPKAELSGAALRAVMQGVA